MEVNVFEYNFGTELFIQVLQIDHGGFTFGERLCPLFEFRVERFPQAFATQVERKHDEKDGESRNESDPRGIENELLAVGKDVAPGGVGWLHAEPEKTQA